MRHGLERLVGLIILGLTAVAAVLLWLAVAREDVNADDERHGVVLGAWRVLYDTHAPSLRVLEIAVAVSLLCGAGLALLEYRVLRRTRRSLNAHQDPLSPRVMMSETRGVFHGEVTVTVLVPAHNEEASLPATLSSLAQQVPPPDRVIVVADNCTDRTVDVARAHGAEVRESVRNTHKKGGALNQALRHLLPHQGENDVVMVMDADTMLDQGFLASAVRRFTEDRGLSAVGGVFYGEEGHGLIGQFQRNEYLRYGREIKRRRGKVFVLTGTASLFRPRALRAVAEHRGSAIPGIRGDVYDTAALTEDNELTIALKSLGALMVSPSECTVVTELMPSWGLLWNQRLRWQRGALENLGAYGVTTATFRYWAQQLAIGYGVFALWGYFVLLGVMLLASDHWVWFTFWLGLGTVFLLERLVTAWKGGWPARLLAITIFPELFFDAFLQLCYVKGVLDISLGRKARWTHVDHPGARRDVTADAS
ncbi:Glycosyltransferase, catalytic subunit of cellulose synthase and poly-beta-1,6-N-acetylglucosamine synthase [Nocardioides terrae]|uniref:Glycosyltransferase, catalytic subunit of cellulose synthase and poly-beta-1,6-N-acetylglucosamine synthase n=1 Tax=Nocardioides terrae TaxID=574651 RepID=A0A1I1JTH5_9ACTN|nr:glycosyltransferase family 2 protein [Nocardioides terrae]SFC49818.1 Glycosyltransferase, catalytic subunit of cellulose synthase and poly-beta-1,6-N-acetylglucosamine synthase [Nocardioides terrae]